MDPQIIAELVKQYGFPIVAAVGMGYFVWFIYKFVTNKLMPLIGETNGILIGILSVRKDATDLSDTTEALFFNVSKFGDASGAAGGTPTTNLQQAYDNSSVAEIVTNSTLGPLTFDLEDYATTYRNCCFAYFPIESSPTLYDLSIVGCNCCKVNHWSYFYNRS